jgi:hypothetical protein
MVVLSQSQGTSLQHDCGKQRILEVLNLEDTQLEHPAPSRLRDREAIFAQRLPRPANLLHDRLRLQLKACFLTRLITLIAVMPLAAIVFSGAFCGFADTPWKVYPSVCA